MICSIESYQHYVCSKCGGIKVRIWESEKHYMFKCDECNERKIIRKVFGGKA